jgi:hypothetical protein
MSNKVAPNTLSRIALVFIMLIPFAVYSQQATDTLPHKKKEHRSIGIGIKAGFNFSNVTKASSINAGSRTGYHLGLLIAPTTHGVLGSRTELIYSRHGYNYTNDTSSGSVNLDYIMLCQYLAIHITKYFEIQLGGQTGYLLHVKADSSRPSTGNASVDQALSFYNRFDSGFGFGAEVHPAGGLLIGARYNISLSNLYKQPSSFSPGQGSGGQIPSFVPNIDLKNNIVQLYLGYRF